MGAEQYSGSDGRRVARWGARLALAGAGVIAVATAACDKPSITAPTVDGLAAVYARPRQEPNLKSLVVSRGGTFVSADYFNGGGPDNPEHVWSVTKSVLALTIGAALDAGCLASLDQTPSELLGPAVTDPGKATVTLRHLLTMSSGIDFPEAPFYATGPSLYQAWVNAPDQIQTPAGSATSSYGYGWWVDRTGAGDAFYLANGWGGQFIFVVPAKQLVVTTAASTSGVSGQAAMNQWQRIYDIVASWVIPAV